MNLQFFLVHGVFHLVGKQVTDLHPRGTRQEARGVGRDQLALLHAGDPERQGLTGHSMGGHGALTIGLKHPDVFKSLSAFAPICTTLHSPWGQKALGHYLGSDTSTWRQYDASEVARNISDVSSISKILVDQGLADDFLEEQLQPERLEAACAESGIELEVRRHEGYDHGYYFISTFIGDHLRHHAALLND